MKSNICILFSIFFVIIFSSCAKKFDENKILTYFPENPEAGEEITIFYNSDSTNLSSAKKINMIVYLYSKELDDTKEIQLEKKENKWTGSFSTSDSTKGVLIKFTNDNKVDNNSKTGYAIHLYGSDNKILPGSLAGLGEAYDSWGSYYLELDRDPNLAYEYFKKDFKINPEIKKDFIDGYLSVISAKFPEKSDSIINNELQKLELQKNRSETELMVLAKWYSKIHNDQKSVQYKNILEKEFPSNVYLQSSDYRKFYVESDINKKLKLAEEFQTKYPESEYTSNIYALLANYYRDNKDYKKAEQFLKDNFDKVDSYRFYSVVSKMLENKVDLKTALQISQMGVDKSRKELKNPSDKKPNYYSEKQWKEDREYLLGLNLYGYGNVLYKINRKEEALPNLEEAVMLTQNEEVELNELYVKALLDSKDYEKALEVSENFIKDGKSTNQLKDLLKAAYIKINGGDKDFNSYIEKFETNLKEKMISNLKEEIINQPAPDFTLNDLDGKKIMLSDLKGKTIIIDFWATWCGPCLSSFPGMKKAVEKYSNNKNVEFLFVNAWERVDNKKENAEKFLAKTKYPFHVLLDDQNEVITKYNVSGIPTKFIIDKNGNIRFVNIGFSGNTDQMVDEISAMISMVN